MDRTQVGTGYIKFETLNGTKEVYVNNSNNTLKGLARAINSSGTGMRASILNDRKDKENPHRLLITGMVNGDDNQVAFPTVYMLDGDQDLYFDEKREAQNAKVKIDGFEVNVSDNVIKDVIPGVTLDCAFRCDGSSR